MSASSPLRRGLPAAAPSAADKRFRRAEVRPVRRRRTVARLFQAMRVVAPVAVLGTVVTLAAGHVLEARFLAIDRLRVTGTSRLSMGEIEGLIGDVRGGSLALVDLEAVRASLLGSQWVADATIRRVLPSTLAIRLVEREPVAIARLGHQLYLVDAAGVIMAEFGPQYADLSLPIVDGLAAPPSDDGPVIDPGRARTAAGFLHALQARPDLLRAVSQVELTASGVRVLLGDDPSWLVLGTERFVERLQTYVEVFPALADRARPVDYVDLRFGDQVFVKDRK
jgi:cell division protein FtsQ